MNDVSWLGPTNASTQRPVEPQRTDDGDGRKREEASFATLLTGDGAEPSQAQTPVQLASMTTRAQTHIPEIAAEFSNMRAHDALSSQARGGSVFFASTQNGPISFRAVARANNEAIAFDARAIVGPASFAHAPDDLFASLEILNAMTFSGSRDAFVDSIGVKGEPIGLAPDSPDTLYRPSPGLSAAATNLTAPAPDAMIAPAIRRSIQSASTSPAAQPAIGNSTKAAGESGAQNASRANSSATVLPVQMASTQSPAFAQVLATPSEYRLVIRSLRLSEDMRDLVMRTVRSGLAEFGLPQMPLSVFEQKGAD